MHSNELSRKTQQLRQTGPKTILHKSLERTLHILERFSYFTHYTSTTAVKVINNPPLIFTHLRCICSKKCVVKLHKTTPVMNSSFSISYCTQLSPRVKTSKHSGRKCVSGFPVRHHTDILWTSHATDATL